MDRDILVKTVMTAFLALGVTAANADNKASEVKTEKCFGVVKAGMNDCPTASSSCAGSAKKDGQPDAFVLTPVGLCERLVGGHLTPPAKETKE